MGLVGSTQTTGAGEVKKEDNADKFKRLKDEKTVKLLLYGPGEVGKTTILRRMMLTHGNDLSEQRKKYRPYLCYNVIEGAYLIIRHAKHLLKFDFKEPGTVKTKKGEYIVTEEDAMHAKRILQATLFHQKAPSQCTLNPSGAGETIPKPDELPNGPAVVRSIQHLYKNNNMFQRLLSARNTFSLYENWTYFVEKLDEYPEWGGEKWVPSDEDLLKSRCRTTGLNKFVFKHDDTQYQLIDVGGQRQERRLFFSLFSQVDAVLFVTSMADYDERCFEDMNAYRLAEGVNAWKKAVNGDAFKDIWIILLFNKLDLFKIKYYDRKKKIKPNFVVKEKPPKQEQEVDREATLAKDWFENLYMDAVPEQKKHQVRVYFTSALGDKEGDRSIEEIMQYCVGFLREKLIEFGTTTF